MSFAWVAHGPFVSPPSFKEEGKDSGDPKDVPSTQGSEPFSFESRKKSDLILFAKLLANFDKDQRNPPT